MITNIREDNEVGWSRGEVNGRTGTFPTNLVIMEDEEPSSSCESDTDYSSSEEEIYEDIDYVKDQGKRDHYCPKNTSDEGMSSRNPSQSITFFNGRSYS